MSKPKNSLVVWLLSGIFGLFIFINFFNSAFPSASIELKLSKAEAFNRAENFILSLGFDLKGFDKSIMFSCDDNAAIYLQKTQGLKRSNELIRKEVPVWFWKLRWFKELEKEGFYADINPSTGEIVRFSHSVLEDAPGADLSQAQALALAQKAVSGQGIDLREYELKDTMADKQKHRTDYSFSWQKKNYKIEDAVLRINVDILGDTLGRFSRYLLVPEVFVRELRKETSLGFALALVSNIFMFLLIIASIAAAVAQNVQNKINWKFGTFFGVLIAAALVISSLNNIPLIWGYYTDTMSKAVFMITSLGGVCISAIISGLLVFVYGATGEPLLRDFDKSKMPLFDAITKKKFVPADIASTLVAGYSLGFIFLGFVTLFYLFGMKIFHIWMPPRSEYSNILGAFFPFLFPLTLALMAAVSEEFIFRMFSILFFKKYLRFTWLAILIPAMVWAFAHSTYPVYPAYVRGIELTIFGVVLGVVFLKYGLETVLIAHFVIDALLVCLPLLKSNNQYYFFTGLIVLMVVLLPVPVALALCKKRNQLC